MRIATLACWLTGLTFATQAQAGHGLFKHRVVPTTSYVGTSAAPTSTCASCGAPAYSSGGVSAVGSGSMSSFDGQVNPPTRPYSYFAARDGMARGYYGYGEDQFPYYGRAYGHPYDPWTWPYMTYGYQNSLNRYYEPPVR